jgi:hypothetical protein
MMLTDWQWGLVYLCWIIAAGSVVAGAFTLVGLFEHRRQRMQGKDPDRYLAKW